MNLIGVFEKNHNYEIYRDGKTKHVIDKTNLKTHELESVRPGVYRVGDLTGSIIPAAIRMYATVLMNRKVDTDSDYISPGGYKLSSLGKSIHFDFEDYSVSVDSSNRRILHIECKNLDYNEFQELENLTEEMLLNIDCIDEFFIFTGEPGETDLRPIKLLELSFNMPYDNFKIIPVSKDIVSVANVCSNIEEE